MLKLAEQLVAQVVETRSRRSARSIHCSSMSFLSKHLSLSERFHLPYSVVLVVVLIDQAARSALVPLIH